MENENEVDNITTLGESPMVVLARWLELEQASKFWGYMRLSAFN